ncbi:MAG: exo-beta-N-acetylmuramidase NamZ family protein, partial [Longimicrobiales bacterium]
MGNITKQPTEVEVFTRADLGDLTGKRVGLMTNHTGRTRSGESTIDVLRRDARIRLVSLFAVEHGIRGTAEAGERVTSSTDEKTGLPIHSLYDATGNFRPTIPMMREIDALVFDIQDIGSRYYTYVWNMILAMEVAAELRKTFVVLDRPNPIGGELVQGRLRNRRDHVGLYPVTMRHGLTAGELARWVNGEFRIGADLRVIPMEGWRRSMWWDETGISWVAPSPNMPSLESAAHYPGTCLFEGTSLSVGRGTPLAFQQIGAPWLKAGDLARRLTEKKLPGVRVEPVRFTPEKPGDNKFAGQAVEGLRFHVTDRRRYDPAITAIHALVEIRRLHGDSLRFSQAHFDRLAGSPNVREQILAGAAAESITRDWGEQVASFERSRAPYLLYR